MSVLLDTISSLRGDDAAVIDERGTTDWHALDDRVTRLVHALRSRGMGPGDRVVALLGNQVELVEISLACALGGWILVPLNWHWVAREVSYVLDDADPTAVVVDRRWAAVLDDALLDASAAVPVRIAVGGGRSGFEDYESVLEDSHAADIADAAKGGPMFYTSGTTGHPKGVRSALTSVGGPPEILTLMAHSLGPTIDVPPLSAATSDTARSVQLVCGPMYHSAQWVFATFALLCGATIVLQHKFDAEAVLDLIDEHGVTNVHLVPTQMARLADLPAPRRDAFDGASLRTVLHLSLIHI